MTNKEIMGAISNIDEVLGSDIHYDETVGYELTSYDFSWLKTAKEALEKQVPKKPVKYAREIVCPTCETLVGSRPYCASCGQAIDWRSDDDEVEDEEIARLRKKLVERNSYETR